MVFKRLIRVGTLASAPQIFDFSTRFARTIILSRLLVPSEFGITVAIGVVVTIAELVGDLGVAKFLMSRPREKDRAALAAAHLLHLVRGVGLAAILAAAAPWIATIFAAPDSTAAFRWCAAIMLLRSVVHLGINQIQRDFRYGPEAAASVAARFAALAVVFPAIALWHDYRAMIVSLLVDAAIYVGMSHRLAETRYSIVVRDRGILREMIAYGLPLTFNGMLWAANSQADRAIVSHFLGLEVLALYAVMLNLATVPVAMMYAILNLLGMSLLARAHTSPRLHAQSYIALVWLHAVTAAGFALSVAALLDLLVPLIYGPAYVVSHIAQALIALIVWMRINRGGPNAVMLFSSDTRPLLLGGSVLATGLILVIVLLPLLPRIETVLAGLLVGETLSLFFFLYAARRQTIASSSAVVGHLAWSFAPVIAACAAVVLFPPGGVWWRVAVLGIGGTITGVQALAGLHFHLLRNGLLTGRGRETGPAPTGAQ